MCGVPYSHVRSVRLEPDLGGSASRRTLHTIVGRKVTKVDDLVAQFDAEFLSDAGTAALDERPNIARRRGAAVHDEVAVRRRNARAADRRALEPGAIDERAGRPGN